MSAGVSLSWREIPVSLLDEHDLWGRVIARADGADWEVRFLFRDPCPLLPVWHGPRLTICPWGNWDKGCPLPRTGWAKQEDVRGGRWQGLELEPVEIPATFGYDNGIWYLVQGNIQGVLVLGHVYMLTEPASHYYAVMTRCQRMPLLVGRRI